MPKLGVIFPLQQLRIFCYSLETVFLGIKGEGRSLAFPVFAELHVPAQSIDSSCMTLLVEVRLLPDVDWCIDHDAADTESLQSRYICFTF